MKETNEQVKEPAQIPDCWEDAQQMAKNEGWEMVFHDLTDGDYGACSRGQPQGDFVDGQFIEHRCIYFPALKFSPEEMRRREFELLEDMCE